MAQINILHDEFHGEWNYTTMLQQNISLSLFLTVF